MESTIKFPRPGRDDCGSVEIAFTGVKFPIEWDRDYYAAVTRYTYTPEQCTGCNGIGDINLLDGSKSICPKCDGMGEIKISSRKYVVGTFRLLRVVLSVDGAELTLETKNARPWSGYSIYIGSCDFATMKLLQGCDDCVRHLYDDVKSAADEAEKLNAQARGEGKDDE